MNTDWIIPDWRAPSSVRALLTTRQGGVSTGPFASLNLGIAVHDDSQAVAENRARLRARLPAEPFWLHQVHGTRIVCAEDSCADATADASWSRRVGTVCAVLTADCLPILFCDEEGTIVAAAHAGWRGLCAGIVEQTVKAMNCAPERLLAWIGPAIGPNRFEVGDDVWTAFRAADRNATMAFKMIRPGKWMADLFTLSRQRLHRVGVTQIWGGGVCTFEDEERFYSHRRDKVTGRMAAAIWLDDKATV